MSILQESIENYIHEMKYKNIDNIHITKHGQVVYSKNFNSEYKEKKHRIASIIKSVLSLGTGIAVDHGYLNLDDSISKYLNGYIDLTSMNMYKKITVRSLLTLSSGLYWQFGIHGSQPLWSNISEEDNWTKAILELPIVNTPGTSFYYKDCDIYLLKQVLQNVMGMSIEEFISRDLYEPLGIICESIDHGFGDDYDNMSSISMLTSEEMSQIGNLCLNHGRYKDKQIVSKEYLELATKKQIDTRDFVNKFCSSDYGYLFWIYGDAYFARGFGGNEIAVFPEYDLVIVIQATAKKISKEYLDIIYDVILKDESILA